MRKEPGRSFGRVPGPQKSNFVEENVEAGRKGREADGTGRVEEEKPLHSVILPSAGFVHRLQLPHDFQSYHTSGGPTTEKIWALRLAAEEFLNVFFGHCGVAEGV